jgi:fructose-1,6-bisphosphatase/inositol monophosphatase family enzyme
LKVALTRRQNNLNLNTGEEDVPPGKEASAAAIEAKLAAYDSNNSNNNKQSSKYLWVVDPIDGTTNFVHGSPLCGPSIAVAYEGEVIVGVIYDPYRKEIFYAVRGYGAYVGIVVEDEDCGGGGRSRTDDINSVASDKNDEDLVVHIITNNNDDDDDDGPRICTTTSSSSRIRIANARRISPPPTTSAATPSHHHHHHRRGPSSLTESLVAMGSPPGDESLAMSLRALPVLMPKVRSIRMIGSAAIMLAWVADGRLSAYWEYDLR